MLVAPLGYNIRVRALQFAVDSTENARTCEKDTLHIFDVSRLQQVFDGPFSFSMRQHLIRKVTHRHALTT